MKKTTSLLLAGLTVLGLSGFTACESNDPVADSGESVLLTELDGHKLTVTGTLSGSPEIASATFCYGEVSYEYVVSSTAAFAEYFIEGTIFIDDWEFQVALDTEDSGTPGTFDVGVTYYDIGNEDQNWTITGIEEFDCTSLRG